MPSSQPNVYFCAIITKRYLAHARVLARSLRAIHPAAQIYVLLADRVDGHFDPAAEPFRTVFLEELSHPQMVEQMSFFYTPFEFCCSLRGLLHEFMWRNTSAPAWILLDSDILVQGDLSEALRVLESASVLLNPHNLAPAPDELVEFELATLRNGIYNGGFVGVRRCAESAQFIQWFAQRLFRYCIATASGLFVDQLWLNHVHCYFRDVALYTHPGANLGHWNLHQRTIALDESGSYLIDGKPLQFVHFSGWNIDHPDDVSKYALPYRGRPLPQLEMWREIAQQYRSMLLENDYSATTQWPYAFDRFHDGTLIDSKMRAEHYSAFWSGVPQRVSPFARSEEFARPGG